MSITVEPMHRVEVHETVDEGIPWMAVAGRLLYGLPFVLFGLMHLSMSAGMAPAVPAWVPGGGQLWVVLTGLALLAAGVSLLVDRWTRLSGPLLAVLLAVFTALIHLPAAMAGNDMEWGSVLKNLALIGAALFLGARPMRHVDVIRT